LVTLSVIFADFVDIYFWSLLWIYRSQSSSESVRVFCVKGSYLLFSLSCNLQNVIMLIRNMNLCFRIVHGFRMVVTQMYSHTLKLEIITGQLLFFAYNRLLSQLTSLRDRLSTNWVSTCLDAMCVQPWTMICCFQ